MNVRDSKTDSLRRSLAFLVGEWPTNYALQRLPLAKWTSINVILWGGVLACTAATKNFQGLMAVRLSVPFPPLSDPQLLTLLDLQLPRLARVVRFAGIQSRHVAVVQEERARDANRCVLSESFLQPPLTSRF